MARLNIPSVWIELPFSVTFAFSSILTFGFERSSMLFLIVVASWRFALKIFLHESSGSRGIIRSHKSQLVIYCYCFQSLADFPLALSFSHETAAKAFHVGTSDPKGQIAFWQNIIWEFSIFALWVRETPQVFIFPLLWTCTFTCSRTRCTTNRVGE